MVIFFFSSDIPSEFQLPIENADYNDAEIHLVEFDDFNGNCFAH